MILDMFPTPLDNVSTELIFAKNGSIEILLGISHGKHRGQ